MRFKLASTALLLAALPTFAQKPVHKPATASVKHAKTKPATKSHAEAMDSERATQIQTALIKQGYLSGSPTGTWDAQSVAAMQKLQGDNGWQTKITPDSRALIKLGLGPAPQPVLPPPQR
jgi:Putative peptidoglycan binding domain